MTGSNVLRLIGANSRRQRTPGLILLAADWSSRDKPSLAVFIKVPCNEHGIQVPGSIPVESLAHDVAMFVDVDMIEQSKFWGAPISKVWKPDIVTYFEPKGLNQHAIFGIPLPSGVDAHTFYKTVWASILDAGTRFDIMTLASHED